MPSGAKSSRAPAGATNAGTACAVGTESLSASGAASAVLLQCWQTTGRVCAPCEVAPGWQQACGSAAVRAAVVATAMAVATLGLTQTHTRWAARNADISVATIGF